MVEVDSIGGDFGALIGTIAKGLQASGQWDEVEAFGKVEVLNLNFWEYTNGIQQSIFFCPLQ